MTAAAFIAAKTSRIRLVLAVMVVPYRPAVLAAKMLATIDVLSGGRLVVGIGAGWLEAEFDAVAVTPFAARGAVTDEYIRAFRTLWTEAAPHHHGDWVKFGDVSVRAEAGAKAASADLGRRRKRAGVATRRASWRRVVSDRQQQPPPARHLAALSRRNRAAAPVHRKRPAATRPRSH